MGELAKFEVKKIIKIQKKDHLRLDLEATSNRLTEGENVLLLHRIDD